MELSCGIGITISSNNSQDPCMLFAKHELESYLTRMFARLAVVDKKGEARFVLCLRQSPMLRYDGYQIVITETDVRITSGQGRGVLHGVYHVLRMLGCSYWFSKASCQSVPTVRRKTLAAGVYTENPQLESRGIALYGVTGDNIADTLTTIDFMAKNGYNLLLTSPHAQHNDMQEHNIFWDEIESTVLPHLLRRGIDVAMAPGRGTAPGVQGDGHCCAPLNLAEYNEDVLTQYLQDVCVYIKDKPYIKLLGPWPFEEQPNDNTDTEAVNKAIALMDTLLHAVRHDIIILHRVNPTAYSSTCLPTSCAVLLAEPDNAYRWAHGADAEHRVFLTDNEMGDSYYCAGNVAVQPHQCKQLIAMAANAGCAGVLSVWKPISSWWAASLNFSILSEAYYHPDFSVAVIISELAEALWDACAVPLSKALGLTVSQLQDRALWSRPPRAPLHITDHIHHRNKVFDLQNADTYDKRYDEILAIINNVSLARLDEHGRYHLDCLKAYLALQKQFFHSVDQYSADDDSYAKLALYYQLLTDAKDKVGEGFLSAEYAKWRIEANGMIE